MGNRWGKQWKQCQTIFLGSKITADGDCSYVKFAGRTINNLRYANDTTLMAESEEELKSLLMKVKEESEKLGLKLNIQMSAIVW